MSTQRWLSALLLLTACGTAEPEPRAEPEPEPEPTACELLGLPSMPFDTSASDDPSRRDLAPDFTVPLLRQETFTLSERWTGCDVLVVVPSSVPISSGNRDSVWKTSVADLIARSPSNARYLFVSRAPNDLLAGDDIVLLRSEVDAALASLPEDQAEHWRDRLHLVPYAAVNLDNWLGRALATGHGRAGLTIDRHQRVRGMGSMAAIDAYNRGLANAGAWPWEARLYTAAKEAHYLNYEAERAARLAEIEALVVPVLTGAVEEEYVDVDLALPDAATIASYDTLEVEVIMECPNRGAPEVGNCGPWDYLAHLWLYDADDQPLEVARFITTYHRESHWVVDASQALPWIADGGTRRLRYVWAVPWNVQPTGVTLNLRFSNQRGGERPVATIPLYRGGNLTDGYNEARPPMTAEIPPDASRVELRALITGHGMDTDNCAEFCNHQHRFEVGGSEVFWEFPEASGTYACRDSVSEGTVPNQGGTWWFGRGGWCPGVEVRPLLADVTSGAAAGEVAVSYRASIAGQEPTGNRGNVRLSSWLVVYR